MTLRCGTAWMAVLLGGMWTTGCRGVPHGRYVDAQRNYVDFHRFGRAFTNIGAGGSEVEIRYEVDGDRVTLHAIDGNPTLRWRADGSLCCGPGGAMRVGR